MGLRTRHGNAATTGIADVLETLPHVEQPRGVPGHADDVSRAAAEERGPFTDGNKRSALGGRARKGKPRMVERISLSPPSDELPTKPYHTAARGLVSAVAATIAKTVGGGQLDPHVGYLVTAAGRAAKWANYFSDVAERMAPGSKDQRETVIAALSADEKASTHLRNAHEYAARMAALREANMSPEQRQARMLGQLGMPPMETKS